jgi:hypothetical protein
LPAVAAKTAAAVSSQIPATLTAATTLALAKSASATQHPPKGKRKRRIALGILAAAIIVPAVVFRNSALVERFTGKGYDSNPLPTHSFPLPPFAGVEYSFAFQTISMQSGIATNYWHTEDVVIDVPSSTAKVTTDLAKASIVGGTIGLPQTMGPKYDTFLTRQYSYEQGATPSDAWVRTPISPDSGMGDILDGKDIRMYQDVFDAALRSLHPSSVTSETRHDVAVTTYTYSFLFGDFYESAPALFDRMHLMEGNAADDAPVTVTISLDEQMLIRYMDVNVDYKSVVEHRAKVATEGFHQYRSTFEVISISDTAPGVSVPGNAVDAPPPTTSTIPTATPEVAP